MRKLLSVLLAAVMLLAVAVPAFADGGDGSSPDVPPIVEGPGVSSKSDGITAKVEQDEAKAKETIDEALEARGLSASDYAGAVAMDVSWDDGSTSAATVVITYTGDGQIAKVLYDHDGWQEAKFEYIGNNQYRIYFTQGLCDVVLLTKAGKPAEPKTGPSTPKSPKTGYD